MRSFGILLLGLGIGVVGMLFLPELTPRREQLNTELEKQKNALEAQVRNLGDQLKNSKTGDEGTKKASPWALNERTENWEKISVGRLSCRGTAAVPPTLAALLLTHRKSLNRSTGRELQVVQLLLQ